MQPYSSGKALHLIFNSEPVLHGQVELSRSESNWYAATPWWSGAVTGPHAIAVLNQAFHAKGPAAGAQLLTFVSEMRKHETMYLERRTDGLLRITIRNAVRGDSAWPNLDSAADVDESRLESEYHDLRLRMYPLEQELERAMEIAVKWDSLDLYQQERLRWWSYRWMREHERLTGSADDARLKLGQLLQVDSNELSKILGKLVRVDAKNITVMIAGVQILPSSFESGGCISISKKPRDDL